MKCENLKCQKEHDGSFGSGRFCSKSCANSKTFSEETNRKKSEKSKEWWLSQSLSKQQELTRRSASTRKINDHNRMLAAEFSSLSDDLKRKRLLYLQNDQCAICSIDQEWNNMPLKFHLDHIDGDRTINNISNLRMVCPNCHSQTPTYGGKNGRKITNEQILELVHTKINNHQICLKLGINPSKRSYLRIDKIRNNIISLM